MRRFVNQCRDIAWQLANPIGRQAWRVEIQALGRGLIAAPQIIDSLRRQDFTVWHWLDKWAERSPDQRAIGDENGSLSWFELRATACDWGAILRRRGVRPGVRVALIADNSAQLVVALLAIQWAGGTVLLLDTRSSKSWLSTALHEFEVSIVLTDCRDLPKEVTVPSTCAVIILEALNQSKAILTHNGHVRHHGLGAEPFLWLVTSGTTGGPKGTCISNNRAVLSGYGIAKLCLALRQGDVIYCVLPLSHATALLTGLCAALIAGCTLVIRRHFETRGFWSDVEREGATSLIYVGEVARYLLSAPYASSEQTHRLRIAYGNSMALDVWHRFQARFRIPRIFEFYGATELPLALVNLGGQPGSIGRTPFGHFSPWRIVRCDLESGELVRRVDGTCIPCETHEAGELVLLTNSHGLGQFSAMTVLDARSTGQHMQQVDCVTCKNNMGLRTGDIVVRDDNGYVKFVDRTFEVFRQNGRNVSTSNLVRQLRQVEGVAGVGLTHLTLPHYDGQLGLAVVVPTDNFSLIALEKGYSRWVNYSRPRFLRVTAQLRLNRGLKFDQAAYRAEGIDPSAISDPAYVYASGHFRLITTNVWRELVLGQFRF